MNASNPRPRLLLWLLAGAILAVAAILYVASAFKIAYELLQVTMLFVGLIGMTAVALLHRLLDEYTGGPLVHVTFNAAGTRASLREVIDIRADEVRPEPSGRDQRWVATSESLLAEDPVLALAKLRIDLEQGLRRLAFEADIRADPLRLNMDELLQALVEAEKIPEQAHQAIRQVLPVYNAAVHGAAVETDVVRAVLGVGADVLMLLESKASAEVLQRSTAPATAASKPSMRL